MFTLVPPQTAPTVSMHTRQVLAHAAVPCRRRILNRHIVSLRIIFLPRGALTISFLCPTLSPSCLSRLSVSVFYRTQP